MYEDWTLELCVSPVMLPASKSFRADTLTLLSSHFHLFPHTAVDATEGFGILTSSSVAPIISVLLINLIKKPMAEVGSKIKSGAKSAIKK